MSSDAPLSWMWPSIALQTLDSQELAAEAIMMRKNLGIHPPAFDASV
jgi:hypothetical protein